MPCYAVDRALAVAVQRLQELAGMAMPNVHERICTERRGNRQQRDSSVSP